MVNASHGETARLGEGRHASLIGGIQSTYRSPHPRGDVGTVALPGDIALDYARLQEVQIAYEVVGPAGAPLLVVLGGISAGRHVTANSGDSRAGWWEPLVGDGRAIDTERFRVVSFDYLGGTGESTCPEQRALRMPPISPRDQARCFRAALRELGMGPVWGIIGASYGGMVGLAWAEIASESLSWLVAISAPHRPHPMATALRSLQREIVRLGSASGREREGLGLARALGITTYRSSNEFALRFRTSPRKLNDNRLVFPVEDYLSNRGRDFCTRFSPHAFLALSESIDLHDIEPARVEIPVHLLGVDSDMLVPSWQIAELAGALGRAEVHLIESIYAHDAFLKETTKVGEILRDILERREKEVCR